MLSTTSDFSAPNCSNSNLLVLQVQFKERPSSNRNQQRSRTSAASCCYAIDLPRLNRLTNIDNEASVEVQSWLVAYVARVIRVLVADLRFSIHRQNSYSAEWWPPQNTHLPQPHLSDDTISPASSGCFAYEL